MAGEVRDLASANNEFSNILLLSSPFTPGSPEWCTRLLSSSDPRDYVLLFVLSTESPENRLESWRSHDDIVAPRQIGFVDLRGTARFGRGISNSETLGGDSEIRIESVNDAGDLTKIGITFVKLLEWADTDRPIAVCFDSMTTLLQYVESDTMYRFLGVLTGRISALGATAHYHLDPTAHEKRDVNLFLSLFDAVVEFNTEEEWQVRTG